MGVTFNLVLALATCTIWVKQLHRVKLLWARGTIVTWREYCSQAMSPTLPRLPSGETGNMTIKHFGVPIEAKI